MVSNNEWATSVLEALWEDCPGIVTYNPLNNPIKFGTLIPLGFTG